VLAAVRLGASKRKNNVDNNTFVGNVLDRGPWLLYDKFQVTQAAAIPQSVQFFSIPIGGQILNGPLVNTAKTKLQTNMKKGNQLPQPQRFLMRSLAWYFDASTWLPDQIAVTEGAYFIFRIDEKIYHEGLLQFFPAGFGIDGTSNIATQQVWRNGQATLTARRDFGDYARVISDALTFSCELIFPAATSAATTAAGGNNLTLECVLDGILDRLVQ
jgi:hypothetical protein